MPAPHPVPHMWGSPETSAIVQLGDGVVTVRVSGEFDLATATMLAEALGQATAAGHDVVLDLADAVFIDVGCLQIIVDAKRRLARGGHRLAVEHPRPVVRRLAAAVQAEDLLGP
jgi:anti-anti-sigma factor